MFINYLTISLARSQVEVQFLSCWPESEVVTAVALPHHQQGWFPQAALTTGTRGQACTSASPLHKAEILESSFRFERIHVPPTRQAHWGSHPINELQMSHSSSSSRCELGRGDGPCCNAESGVLPRARQGREDSLQHHCGAALPCVMPGGMGTPQRHSLRTPLE